MPSGVCEIKKEFVLPEQEKVLDLNLVAEQDKIELGNKRPHDESDDLDQHKKQKRFGVKLSSKEKAKLRGQNKARGATFRVNHELEICHNLIDLSLNQETPKCERNNCRFLHDIAKYLESKPKDISEFCYNYRISGKCPRGLACRFGSEHITEDGRNKVDEEKFAKWTKENCTKNQLVNELQISLRKRQYNFDLALKFVEYNSKLVKKNKGVNNQNSSDGNGKAGSENATNIENNKNATETGTPDSGISKSKSSGTVTDEDIISLLKREKKKIDWTDKLILSPLTTVGNLPFRRICKEFGAEVTCGEMAMCSSLLQGHTQEWALVKRHHSEDIFGVQLCANNPYELTKCGQMLQKECDIDFIDLNLGCPIDLVYQKGGGCGLLRKQTALETCIRSLSDVLTIPMTVKTRTGIHKNENVAHILAPKFREWGASLITIHGRSREQRYTKQANWDYIREVAQAASPLPVVGNGDILSFDEYQNCKKIAPEITSVMIGRGALIKPWIFEEIKEQKLLDISSSERFEIIKKYCNYGLEHWGSDNRGVENTRKFLLEWLSFLYRYIPVGVLEHPPQRINERPPLYKGRDDLETLMASPRASDWIKISEMILGPVPEGFKFLPKHKANSYN